MTSGCVSGSLASSTGPRAGDSRWSVAPRQYVHVGETVLFDFVLTEPGSGRLVDPIGVVDYCDVTLRNRRLHVDPDPVGHFLFTHGFDDVPAGEEILVTARGYRVRGHRDFMNIEGEWMRSESPNDLPDSVVVEDSIRVTAYAVELAWRIESPDAPLDAESGVLRFHRTDEPETLRYVDRPHRPGFTLHGPDGQGGYVVRYAASGDELDVTGQTSVELVIHDRDGKRYAMSRTLETP